ncbi:MAG: helix-turn-helix domain-containing protein [Natronospirillum sp.]|uniref:Crp/Fnr family transcriptional regulator n=1 Tax=Natronospirillum sp. TaxID=2812955 RepID=UPI0025EA8335|nr:helix-turn-helix domain-containing protein [Natronospirillum sp.]MCH8553058.1 helix-turn-helix domain-containing protein [Natronospirillum sp.]
MYTSDRAMRHVYFPVDSIISLQYPMTSGSSTAFSVVGNEGVLGITVCLAGESAPSRSLVQSAGYAYRLPRTKLKEEFGRDGQLFFLMLRYAQSLITQVAQTTLCNLHHSIIQQLARWLLLSLDRMSHSHLAMSQEFIGNMLGVRRECVAEAAMTLQELGAIAYKPGMITVIDRSKLETLSCECYGLVRKESDRLLHYLPQLQDTRTLKSVPASAEPSYGCNSAIRSLDRVGK